MEKIGMTGMQVELIIDYDQECLINDPRNNLV